MQERLYISLEFTPNPNTLKYSINRQILGSGAANFTSLEEAKKGSPLAAKLLEISGISGVMIGRDFVTISKSEDGDWDFVHRTASQVLESHLSENLPVVDESFSNRHRTSNSEDGLIERKILGILDNEIRPAVAMDGGDITYDRYADGVVYLHLQGSCSGCPSAAATLKVGIETRLKEVIPEIKEVVSI